MQELAGAPVFQVDAGGLFNLWTRPGSSDDARSRALFEGATKLGVDIVNLTPADAHELDRLKIARGKTGPQFVTANVFGVGHKTLAPAYAVRRGGDGSRIVFIGLSAVPQREAAGYEVENAREALARLLPQVRSAGDIVVVLAYMSNKDVVDMAVNVPGVDVIVAAWEEQFAVAPYQFGNAWILQAQFEGRMVGHVGLQLSAGKRLEKFAPQQIVALDASYADDADMAAIVDKVVVPTGGK